MNRRLFLGHVLAAVGAIASVPLLTKLLPLPFPAKSPLMFHKDAFAMVMGPIFIDPVSGNRMMRVTGEGRPDSH